MMFRPNFALISAFWLTTAGCADTENPDGINENELITTVVLVFSPADGGAESEFRWSDPEGDGSPLVDDIMLAEGVSYDLSVGFLSEMEDPPEDITVEVDAESDEHQVFFTGTAVQGPATGDNPDAVITHDYADSDDYGLAVGLDNTIVADIAGSGSFVVTLRHLPPQGDVAVKTSSLAADLAAGDFDSLPGDTDVQVTFDLEVE